jgi:acetyltransferase-like isoleucine patch superfamily enzyme
MNIKHYIALKFKLLFAKIAQTNVLSLAQGSLISKKSVINESNLKGDIQIADHSSIIKSNLNGKIVVNTFSKISSATLSGQINVGVNSKVVDGVLLEGHISIGNYSSVNGPNTDMKAVINKISIGNFCSIARNVTFQEYNHDFTRLTSYFVHRNLENKPMKEDVISKGDIIIEHDVWIGTHCVILSGVTIGTGAVVAANTVVTSNIPPYAIVAGSPAKIIKYRFDEKTISDLLQSKWWEKDKDEVLKMYYQFDKDKSVMSS